MSATPTCALRQQPGDTGAEAAGSENPTSPAEVRGFESDELKPLKVAQLRALIKNQLDNLKAPLPPSLKFNKAPKRALIELLTNPTYGFTTRKPKLVFNRGIGVQTQKKKNRTRRSDTNASPPSTSLATAISAPISSQHTGASQPQELGSSPSLLSAATQPSLHQGQSASSASAHASNFLGNFDQSSFGGFSFENLYAFDFPPARITLTLYILDERSPAPLPDLVKVTVSVVRNLAGGAVADWHEIIGEIQKTASAIRGSNLKLSYSRSDKDTYKIAILQALASPVDQASIFEAELLVDEARPVYRLHVEPLSPTSPIPRRAPTPVVDAALETLERYSSSHPGMRTMPQLRQRGKSRVVVDEDAAGRDKDWLRDQVSKRAGYEVMTKKHDTKMPYAGVAQQWAFAVSCLNELTRQRFPHSKGQIYSYHVWDALSRKGTWCLAAKEGHRLYREYADHPDVVEAVKDTSRKGHLGFLALLRQVGGE
ncbi:uncharacterized protein SCHCODRAFT_02559126 [Schizophyllum commune H4-8]|nr:uncharacterized protein SCHCODRAFT_02559126 [Schizophyllum commune H4-8]KAI5899020.1 hypothetical protein SCHCODRAFT_02559126 [Schizophyllum commune H4-8]